MSNLIRFLKPDHILPNMKSKKKVEAIRELASILKDGSEVRDFRRYLSALIQRESQFCSVVNHGVALPHYRDDLVQEPVVCLGILRGGIEFGEAGEQVKILVLICWPNRHEQVYLQTVAEIARLLRRRSLRRRILQTDTPKDIMKILREEEL